MRIDGWDIFGLLYGLVLIGSGFHGFANRKRINNLGHLIISIGQIRLGVFALVATTLFIMRCKAKMLYELFPQMVVYPLLTQKVIFTKEELLEMVEKVNVWRGWYRKPVRRNLCD